MFLVSSIALLTHLCASGWRRIHVCFVCVYLVSAIRANAGSGQFPPHSACWRSERHCTRKEPKGSSAAVRGLNGLECEENDRAHEKGLERIVPFLHLC